MDHVFGKHLPEGRVVVAHVLGIDTQQRNGGARAVAVGVGTDITIFCPCVAVTQIGHKHGEL